MEDRFAFVLRIWHTESPTLAGQRVGTVRGTVQAADSFVANHFVSLPHLNKLIQGALPPHKASKDTPTLSDLSERQSKFRSQT